MTTQQDLGTKSPQMLRCELRDSNLYPTLVLALRDMREANGREETTGAGVGNRSWIGLSLGMVVLDTLSGDDPKVGARWERLLTAHGVSTDDARIIYKLRCSLLHGYGLPQPKDVLGRKVVITPDRDAYALDTSKDGLAVVSVPAFCGCLVERIVAEAPDDWDISLIDTDLHPGPGPPTLPLGSDMPAATPPDRSTCSASNAPEPDITTLRRNPARLVHAPPQPGTLAVTLR
jgi:hypothetical protein